MASHRTALGRIGVSENEGQRNRLVGKAALAGSVAGGLKAIAKPIRGAMQEIGNTGQITQTRDVSKAPEAVKPPRGLTKQKATVSLKNVPEQPTRIMPKRKSAEKSAEPMDMSSKNEDAKNIDFDLEEMEIDSQITAFSAERLALVEDIDKDDHDDPQLVTDYVNKIYIYLRKLEKEQNVEKDYLGNRRGGVILPKMRAVLIDWLVDVHLQFSMLQETLYLTVAILDRFLQKSAKDISRKSLQLVGVTAMFIASKYEEMYAPEIGDFVYITDNAYTQSQIRQMEIEILRVLNFDLGRPLPLHFLRRNSKAGCVDANVHTLAKYIMELTIVEYNLMHIPPSKLAAASLLISMKFFSNGATSLSDFWTPTLAYYAMYEWKDIAEISKELLVIIQKTSNAPEEAKLMAIRKKYSNKKFGMISVKAQKRVGDFERMEAELSND